MKKIFITGSTTGLGFIAGELLLKEGHQIILHARSEERAAEAKAKLKKDIPFVIGDLSTLAGMKSVAEQVKSFGQINSIIQNAGVYGNDGEAMTVDGLRTMFAVNVMAPYVLTCLLGKPERMASLSSGLHMGGEASLQDLQWNERTFNSAQAYADSKLFVLMMTKWFARKWNTSYINAVDPGWVPTRMGGAGAPDDLVLGAKTQAWLTTSDDPQALVSGNYFHHQQIKKHNPQADNLDAQEKLIAYLKETSKISC
jgi:NAD(P)-dependent dehydrogenase (short-subunit alcohol dehydrogenase family)